MDAVLEGGQKRCPYCAETILAEAVRCRYCHADLRAAPATPSIPPLQTPLLPVSDILATKGRGVGAVIFGVLLICFALPFVEFSCGGEKVLTLSGGNLVVGFDDSSGALGQGRGNRTNPEATVVVAFLAGFSGLASAFAKRRSGRVVGLVSGAIGVLGLVGLAVRVSGELDKKGMEGAIEVGFGVGFWLVAMLFVAAIVWNALLLRTEEEQGV